MARRIAYLAALLGLALASATVHGAAAAASAPASAPAPRVRVPATLPSSLAALPTGGYVAVVPVHGLLYEFTLESLKRRCQRAVQDGATLIVVEIDSPGGLVEHSIKISHFLKDLPVPTIAWVNDRAISGGSIVAAACRWVFMHPRSAIGCTAPIIQGRSLTPTERAKAESEVLADFRDSAALNGYDFAVFQAMVQLGVELYLIEDPQTLQRKVVNRVDYELMVHGRDPTHGTGALLPPAGALEHATLARQVARDEDLGRWRPVTQGRAGPLLQPVHDGTTLLTLSQERALELGLAKVLVRDDGDLKQLLNARHFVRYDQVWVQGLAYWLSLPVVRAILLLVLMVAAYIEFQTPGLGIAGAIAVVALVILVGAPFLIGLAEWWHLMVFLVGLGLLLIEIFVTPGFGLLGVAGLVCMFGGAALMGTPSAGGSALPAPELINRLQWSVLLLLLSLIGGVVAIAFLTRHFGQLPFLNRLVLRAEVGAPTAVTAMGAPAPVAGGEALAQGQIEVGQTGVVVSDLKPTGRARIGPAIVDVTSRGDWIEPGRAVRVVEVRGNLIVVDAA